MPERSSNGAGGGFEQQAGELALLMGGAGLPDALIRQFCAMYRDYCGGNDGFVPWAEVSTPPAEALIDCRQLDRAALEPTGRRALSQLVCIKLNGGLGTTMKLDRAKSLIKVRAERTFLSLCTEHIAALRRASAAPLPLLLMNSFHTRADSLEALGDFVQPGALPTDFLQHKVPRVVEVDGTPACFEDQAANWAPPGHGDIYLALEVSGLLQQLIDQGYRWAFVSNVDNLGATVDLGLLGLIEREGIDFAMEVTPKTPVDRKGGTLVHRGGRLMLLERSQVCPQRIAAFEDIERFTVFNTNSLWWRLTAIKRALDNGELQMPMIVNRKRVAGVDVVQLEVAMGAAIGCFERAAGLMVSRSRFAPVKSTADLLAVRSDAYSLDDRGGLRPSPDRDQLLGPPVITLDKRYYRGLDDFEQRFAEPPSLVACRSLSIIGDVSFGRAVKLCGDVTLVNHSGQQQRIEDRCTLTDTERRW